MLESIILYRKEYTIQNQPKNIAWTYPILFEAIKERTKKTNM